MSEIKRLTYSTFGRYDHAEAENDQERFLRSTVERLCPFCKTKYRHFTHLFAQPLTTVTPADVPGILFDSQNHTLELLLCPACGWWHLTRNNTVVNRETGKRHTATWFQLYHAVYSEIALNSPDLPIAELRKHLTRFWKDRRHISAQQAEDLVASILREHYGGEILRITANANSPDDGIDLFMVSDGDIVRRAVQIKRRIAHDVEPVQDVRNFIGAMVLSGNEKGMFVTTAARFSSAAVKIRQNTNLVRQKLEVELIDGERLLELLEHSNLQRGTQLPPLVRLDQEWTSVDGMRANTEMLLFGDLSRISGKPSSA
jgi:hypothetical protein